MLRLRYACRLRTAGRDESGAVMVVVALTLVVLLGMAALVVDLGNARQQRGQGQNAADASALAAARALLLPDATGACAGAGGRALAVCVAEDLVNTDFGTVAADWSACPPADDALAPVASLTTACVSFNAGNTRVNVRTPYKTITFQFAQVLGFDSTDVAASASAEAQSPGDREIPLLVLGGASGLLCVEQGGSTPCHDRNQGNFGSLTSPRYRTFTSASKPDEVNFAVGLDHIVRQWTGTPNVCDTDDTGPRTKCTNLSGGGDWNNDPATWDLANWAVLEQGNALADVTNGLVRDTGGVKARLKRADGADPTVAQPPGPPASPTLTMMGQTLNGRHIAAYMTTTAGALLRTTTWGPQGSAKASSDNVDSSFWETPPVGLGNAGLGTVLTGAVQPIFAASIVDSPRFGFIPMSDADGTCTAPFTWPSGNSGPAKVCDLAAMYIDRVYTNGGGTKVVSLRAFVFDPAFIETAPAKPGAGMPYVGGPFVTNLVK